MMTQTFYVRRCNPGWAGRPGSLGFAGRGSLISPGVAGRGARDGDPPRPCLPWTHRGYTIAIDADPARHTGRPGSPLMCQDRPGRAAAADIWALARVCLVCQGRVPVPVGAGGSRRRRGWRRFFFFVTNFRIIQRFA